MTASFSTDGACQFYCILAIEETDFMLKELVVVLWQWSNEENANT